MSTKSLQNEIAVRSAAGLPQVTDLILFAPLPNTPFVTQAKHCTVADLLTAVGAVAIPAGEIVYGTGPSVTSTPNFKFDSATQAQVIKGSGWTEPGPDPIAFLNTTVSANIADGIHIGQYDGGGLYVVEGNYAGFQLYSDGAGATDIYLGTGATPQKLQLHDCYLVGFAPEPPAANGYQFAKFEVERSTGDAVNAFFGATFIANVKVAPSASATGAQNFGTVTAGVHVGLNIYGSRNVAESSGAAQLGVGGTLIGATSYVNALGTSVVPSGYGFYSNLVKAVGATLTVGVHYWAPAIGGIPGYAAAFWSDEQGVFRIKADNTFNGVYQAIPALYNPQVTKYVPNAADFERWVVQWNTNVIEIGAEAGGTGTLRAVKIIGASLQAPAYKANDGSLGIATTITTANLVGKTITVKDGLITSFA